MLNEVRQFHQHHKRFFVTRAEFVRQRAMRREFCDALDRAYCFASTLSVTGF
jgi:hypothetical protein